VQIGMGIYTPVMAGFSTMVEAIPFMVEGWHAPASRSRPAFRHVPAQARRKAVACQLP
jgi:hypothetical protein